MYRGWRGALGLYADGTMGDDACADDIRYAIENGWPGDMRIGDYVPTRIGNMTSLD